MTTESREQDHGSARASRKSRGSPAIIEAGGSGACALCDASGRCTFACEIGRPTDGRPDAADLFEAITEAMVGGFETVSIQGGVLRIGENAFDAHAILHRLLACGLQSGGSALDRAAEALPADVVRLVVAARIVAFENQSPEAIRELDQASEAFAGRVPWDDEPPREAETDERRDPHLLKARAISAVEVWLDWCHYDETMWDAFSESEAGTAWAERRRKAAEEAKRLLETFGVSRAPGSAERGLAGRQGSGANTSEGTPATDEQP